MTDPESRPVTTGSIEIVAKSRRRGYGVEATRVNASMDYNPPRYTPYEQFEDFETYVDDECLIAGEQEYVDEHENQLVGLPSGIDETVYSSGIHARMERIKCQERHAIMILQHDLEHRVIVDLLKVLEDAQCPDYMLQKVLQRAYQAKLDGFDFNPKATTRKAHIQWMYQALEQSHQRLPQVFLVTLEGHDKAQDVVCFDFVPALLSLLQDNALMRPENLVIDEEYPTKMYWPADENIGEAHTGERYRELYQELITKENQLLVPLILYLDGTIIDSKGHIEVCPVSFTTSLFTEKLRRHHKAWRVIGYVPDMSRNRSSALNAHGNNNYIKGRTTRNFHGIMDVILNGISRAQAGKDSRLRKVPLKIGGRWIIVDIVCPLLFVINDGKQGDQLCCRVNGHHPSQVRHHRSCDCNFDDLDNPDVECNFLRTDQINTACREGSDDDLRELCTYRVDNSFNRIQMGNNPHGIFMCAVVDVMHTVQHGIIMYSLESFKKGIGIETLALIDKKAISFDRRCCQSIRANFP